MMADKIFCDTNIILRAYHDSFPEHETVKATFDHFLAEHDLWISRQVIREYLVQATHPRTFETPLTGEQVVEQVGNILKSCFVADETKATTLQLLSLLKSYPVSGKQIHDANIVAAMLSNGIDTLLTLNIADFKRYEDKITLLTPGQEAE